MTKTRARRKVTRTKRSVDVRALPSPTAMASAIDAIVTQQPASKTYRVMTAVAYYAGLRPSEVVMLRVRSTELPADGWGRLDVTEADISFDEPGEPKTGPRSVPIPPVLVAMLRDWVQQNGLTSPHQPRGGDDMAPRRDAARRDGATTRAQRRNTRLDLCGRA